MSENNQNYVISDESLREIIEKRNKSQWMVAHSILFSMATELIRLRRIEERVKRLVNVMYVLGGDAISDDYKALCDALKESEPENE